MRYLNKIIFVNSAHVPYAEVKLDGNVHFIGTQGVGKSTLLRAILFFYNVDKSKLGIRTQDKQKSYDEFYLPYPNSYIIYEVCRETGKFFVMTFLSHGRTAFRIVDCPYDRRFFVEDDGSVRYEWGRISEAIGTRTFKSNIIRGYEEFRDIMYGNVQNVAKELRRFCFLESSKYQNVPRTIQNIFLNQSLESRVIKDTIIDSMDFANDGIDLNFYREHVKNFRQQYDDIWKWYRREKNGKVKVQTDAENVISRYTLYEGCRKAIVELCGNLNYALERDSELIPQIEKQGTECSLELLKQRRLLGEEEGKYNGELAKLNQEDGALKAFLDKAKEKRLHYAEVGIEKIAERVGKERGLKVSQESLKHQESLLTDKNRGVKSKYDSLQRDVENQLREHKLQAQQQKNELDRECTTAIDRMQSEQNDKLEAIRNQCQDKLDEIQEEIGNVQQQKNELRLKEQKALRMNPYQHEMDEFKRKIDDLQKRNNLLIRDSASKQQDIDRMTSEVALKRKDLENECERDIAQVENRIGIISTDISRLNELLSRQKGSLIEWLEAHVDGWESNIGKVLDEDAVLYNTFLNPQRKDSSDTIFGMKIDVENIDRTIRTPEEVKEQKAAKEQEISNLRHQAGNRRRKLEADIAELERKPSFRLKALRMEKMNVDAELKQIPAIIENIQKDLRISEDNLREWHKSEQMEIQCSLDKVEKALEMLNGKKQSILSQRNKETDNLSKVFNKQKSVIIAEAEYKKEGINSGIAQKERETVLRKKELEALMDAELKGLGVDINQLANIRRQLRSVADELAFIDNHRSEYISWLNDTKEYFDNEQAKKEERKGVKLKIDNLQQKFESRRAKLNGEIGRLSDEFHFLQDRQERLSNAVERVKTFMCSTSCPAELHEVEKAETCKPLVDIFEELRDNITTRQRRMEEFKQAVGAFKGNFSPQNTFHFCTEFHTEADYTEFAADLNDFLSNKKIEEYRVRTSSQYATIIKRIAREVSDLDKHNADIKNTINEINRDFRENNFAGVIKEIELRAVESNDRLMQQLLSIKKFDDDNGFNIGQLNLFSDEDNLSRTNQQAVNLLMALIDQMDAEQKRDCITLSDTFKLEFKVKENDNDTNWVEKLSNVGSDGTDILVKAMVNIMLINVFKRKISRKFGDFKLHCMMDEIGKLHPNNVEGILKFANVRNIFLINSSPTTYNASAYRYTYSLSKDDRSNTVVKTLLTIK